MKEPRVVVFDDMRQCTDSEVARLLPLVSDQRREQALRFRHTLGRFCCLKSWIMVEEERTKVKGERTKGEWTYNEHGKPYFQLKGESGKDEGLYFSISHCKAGIAVVVAEQEVGIDIEAIRHADEELIRRTMNEAEQQAIHSDRDFTRLWTQKEAVVKCLGTGIESFEQLQGILCSGQVEHLETIEKENYIYSIAYGK